MLRFLVLAALALGPPVAAADERIERLPERLRAWIEDEVVYIISAREKEFFLNLEAMEERDAFVAAFWRRRDPDPLTEINEFREEHYRRIDYANLRLGGEAAIPGWKTDRGRMYIILGEPRDRSNFRNVGGIYPAEVWFYDGDRAVGLPPLYLLFFQPGGAGALRLYNHFIDRPERLIPSMGILAEDLAEAYLRLQEISPELANAAMSMRADQGGFSFSTGLEAGALDSGQVLANIHESPYRRLDTGYIDAARSARGLVEAEYMFNYMPSSVAANVLPGPAGESLVHFSIEIDPQHLTLMQEENRFYTAFELHAEVSSAGGEVVHTLSHVEYLRLEPGQLRQVGRLPFAYRSIFPLAAGHYRLRIVFKNRARSDYTTFEGELRAPEWREGEPFLGEPVLLYNAEPVGPEPRPGYRSYVVAGLVLHPNAKRVYSIGEPLRVHVPVRGASGDHELRFRVFPGVDSDVPLVSQSAPLSEYRMRPVFEIRDLPEAVGGRYQLRIDLVDGSGQIAASRVSGFDVSPREAVPRPWAMYGTNDFAHPASVLATLGNQYDEQGDRARAMELFERALEQRPDLTEARVPLARIRLDQGDASGAIGLLEPIYRADPESYDVVVVLGAAYQRMGEPARALELLRQALRLRGAEPQVLNLLASCEAELGNVPRAIEYLERSLELLPDQDDVREQLGRLKNASGKENRILDGAPKFGPSHGDVTGAATRGWKKPSEPRSIQDSGTTRFAARWAARAGVNAPTGRTGRRSLSGAAGYSVLRKAMRAGRSASLTSTPSPGCTSKTSSRDLAEPSWRSARRNFTPRRDGGLNRSSPSSSVRPTLWTPGEV